MTGAEDVASKPELVDAFYKAVSLLSFLCIFPLLFCCLPTSIAKATPFYWIHERFWKLTKRGPFWTFTAWAYRKGNYNLKGKELETVPPRAKMFKVNRKTVNAVQLKWKFEDKNVYNKENEYIVEVEVEGGVWHEAFRTKEEYCMIKELIPDTVYKFQVCAENSKGRGPVYKIKVKTKIVANQWHGAQGKGFYWMQDPLEVTVVVPIPKDVKSKDIEIKLDERLLIRIRDTVVMDGIIWLPYDEHLWEIDRSGDIHVVILSIEKRQEEEAWPWPIKGVDQVETELIDYKRPKPTEKPEAGAVPTAL